MYQNKVNLIGFTGKDVNARSTKNNRSYAVVLVATKSSYRDKQSGEFVSRTEWHRCIAWGTLAQVVEKLPKGSHVQLEGEVRTREYTDREQNKRRVQEVHICSIRKLDRAERAAESVAVTAQPVEEAASGVPF
jgi:single-strand DNA-binding protein